MPRDLFATTAKQPRDLFAAMPAPESQTSQDTRAQLSEFTQHPSRGAFEQLSIPGKVGQAADDVMRLMASGGSFGFADKVAAGGDPQRLQAERAMTEAARDRAGWAGTTAELGGAMMAPAGLAKQGVTLIGKGVQAIPGVKGLLARSLLMGGEGAGYGAASAAGNDQDIGRGAVSGAILGGAGNVFGEGLSSVFKGVGQALAKPGSRAPEEVLSELDAAKNAAYAASEKAGVIIKPQGMKHLAERVKDDLAEFGYDETLHPGAKAVLRKIDENQGKNVTLKGLDGIRKVAGNVGYIPGNKSNNAAVSKIVDHIEELYRSRDPEHMAGIDTAMGTKALDEARALAHQSFKLEKSLNLVKKGNQQADRNITDTRVKSIKSQLAKINDPFSSWGRGYTEAEKAAAEKAAKFTTAERLLHGASVLNPVGGGKLSAAAHLALAGTNLMSGNLPGLLMQGAGAGAGVGFQKMAHALAGNNVREFTDLVSRGGKLAPPIPEHALERLAKSKKDLLIRALLGGGIAMGQQ